MIKSGGRCACGPFSSFCDASFCLSCSGLVELRVSRAGLSLVGCLARVVGYTELALLAVGLIDFEHVTRPRFLNEVPLPVMDSNAIFAILLLIAGIGILTAEVFLPSGGLLGIVTFFTLTISLTFAYRAWGTSQPGIFWGFCGVLLLLVPTALGGAFYVLPHTALGRRVLLEAPTAEELTPFTKETDRLTKLIGRFGKAVTPLVPGGMVLLDGERLHAFSEGMIVESGKSVEILEVRGSRLLVRPGVPSASNDPFTAEATATRPLDFEFPQS